MSKFISCRLNDRDESCLDAIASRYDITTSKVIKLLLNHTTSTSFSDLDAFYINMKDEIFKYNNSRR